MKKLIHIIIFVFGICSACNGTDKKTPSEQGQLELQDSNESAQAVEAQDSSSVNEETVTLESVPLLAQGAHWAFGIRMPRGMMPMKSHGDHVVRFEGTHSIVVMRRYIENQLVMPINIEKLDYTEGYIIRYGVPKSSLKGEQADSRMKESYAIKIFNGSIGGAAVDIWKEAPKAGPETAAQIAGRSVQKKNDNYVSRLRKRRNPDVPRPKTSRDKTKSFFNVTEKMASGAPLTEEDYNSPFFTER